MPVAPVVLCVMLVRAVLIHKVGVEDATLTVLFGVTVTATAAVVKLPEQAASVFVTVQ